MAIPVTPPRNRSHSKNINLISPNSPFNGSSKSSLSVLNKNTIKKKVELTPKAIFPPTPSTIGSGRKKNYHLNLNLNTIPLPTASPNVRSISRNIDLEIDNTNEITGEDTNNSKRRLNFENLSSDSEREEDELPKAVFKTPGKQLITDDLAKKWNNKDDFSDDEDQDGEIFIKNAPLKNPFITNETAGSDEFKIKRKNVQNIDDREIIYINKKGERLISNFNKNSYQEEEELSLLTRPKPSNNLKFKVYNDE